MAKTEAPIEKQAEPNDGWNGRFYDAPTTGGHRMYNAGYGKGREEQKKRWEELKAWLMDNGSNNGTCLSILQQMLKIEQSN